MSLSYRHAEQQHHHQHHHQQQQQVEKPHATNSITTISSPPSLTSNLLSFILLCLGSILFGVLYAFLQERVFSLPDFRFGGVVALLTSLTVVVTATCESLLIWSFGKCVVCLDNWKTKLEGKGKISKIKSSDDLELELVQRKTRQYDLVEFFPAISTMPTTATSTLVPPITHRHHQHHHHNNNNNNNNSNNNNNADHHSSIINIINDINNIINNNNNNNNRVLVSIGVSEDIAVDDRALNSDLVELGVTTSVHNSTNVGYKQSTQARFRGVLEHMCGVRREMVFDFAIVSLLTYFGMYFSNWALQYVSYTVRVVFKSSKLVVVMFTGTLIVRDRRYSFRQYLIGLIIVAAVFFFMIGDLSSSASKHVSSFAEPSSTNKDSNLDSFSTNSWIKSFVFEQSHHVKGISLMVVAVLCDAATGNFEEERLFRRWHCAPRDILRFTYSLAIFWGLVTTLYSGEFWNAIDYAEQNNLTSSLLFAICGFSVVGYLSMVCGLLLVKLFSATVAEGVKSVRKMASVLVSFVVFGKQVEPLHLVGLMLFLCSVAVTWSENVRLVHTVVDDNDIDYSDQQEDDDDDDDKSHGTEWMIVMVGHYFRQWKVWMSSRLGLEPRYEPVRVEEDTMS